MKFNKGQLLRIAIVLPLICTILAGTHAAADETVSVIHVRGENGEGVHSDVIISRGHNTVVEDETDINGVAKLKAPVPCAQHTLRIRPRTLAYKGSAHLFDCKNPEVFKLSKTDWSQYMAAFSREDGNVFATLVTNQTSLSGVPGTNAFLSSELASRLEKVNPEGAKQARRISYASFANVIDYDGPIFKNEDRLELTEAYSSAINFYKEKNDLNNERQLLGVKTLKFAAGHDLASLMYENVSPADLDAVKEKSKQSLGSQFEWKWDDTHLQQLSPDAFNIVNGLKEAEEKKLPPNETAPLWYNFVVNSKSVDPNFRVAAKKKLYSNVGEYLGTSDFYTFDRLQNDYVITPIGKETLMHFQEQRQLSVDGILGPQTIHSLALGNNIPAQPYQ